jgi:hypothetical protein
MNFLRYVDGAKPGKRLKLTTPTPEEKKNFKKKSMNLKGKESFKNNG